MRINRFSNDDDQGWGTMRERYDTGEITIIVDGFRNFRNNSNDKSRRNTMTRGLQRRIENDMRDER